MVADSDCLPEPPVVSSYCDSRRGFRGVVAEEGQRCAVVRLSELSRFDHYLLGKVGLRRV